MTERKPPCGRVCRREVMKGISVTMNKMDLKRLLEFVAEHREAIIMFLNMLLACSEREHRSRTEE